MGITVTTCPKLLSCLYSYWNCQNMQDLGMEMTAYCSESSSGAWREAVFELKLLNNLVLQEHFHKRIVVEWRNCPLHRRKAKKNPECHAWLCQELLCDSKQSPSLLFSFVFLSHCTSAVSIGKERFMSVLGI